VVLPSLSASSLAIRKKCGMSNSQIDLLFLVLLKEATLRRYKKEKRSYIQTDPHARTYICI